MVPSNHSSGGLTEQLPLTGLLNPTGVTLDGSGDVYVTDLNGTVVKLLVNSGVLPIFPAVGGTQTTTVTNTGNLPLTTTGATFSSNAGTFTESDNCQNIPGGGTCVITIKYAQNRARESDGHHQQQRIRACGGHDRTQPLNKCADMWCARAHHIFCSII